MRTIKFRARRKNGEWVVGNFIHHFATCFKNKERHSIFLPKPKNDNDGYWVEDIEPQTIGQFTGLKDAHGKEIYEGDILKWKADNRLYAVIFNWGMFYASVEVCNQEIYGGSPLHSLTDDEACEIVGNIYDNPELIKK